MTSTFIPAYRTPDRNSRLLLTARPSSIPLASHFSLHDAPLEPVGEGQFRVRNIYLSVDPAQRGWANMATGEPGAVHLGAVMRALAVGVVCESRNAAFPLGLHLYGWFGWQDYAVVGPEAVFTRIDPVSAPLSAYAGVLGMTGLTAYLALDLIGRPHCGETVLVSTAAGSVGSIVGQLAREAGCHVFGLTGDDAKVKLCIERFGYDAAANYKTGALADIIATLVPDGVNVYFDNVGGATLDAAIRSMKMGGRIVQCGTASVDSWSPPPVGLRNEREVLMRRLVWGGFVIFDHTVHFAEALATLSGLLTAGKLVHDEDIAIGIEHAPSALTRLFAGENSGKQLIYIG